MNPQDDLEFLKDQDRWPSWPVQPVKHRREKDAGLGRIGIVIPSGPTVYLKNMYDLEGGLLADLLKDVPSEKYESWEELVKDWQVD